jgi:hypothetical protein
MQYFVWACLLGALSAVSLPLGSWIGIRFKFAPRVIAILAAFGAGALLAALSVELIAPTTFALVESGPEDRGEHLTAFLALIVGCVCGGLLYVALDHVIGMKGGFLRKTSTLLTYYHKRNMEERRGILRRLSQIPLFEDFPPAHIETLLSMLEPVEFDDGEVLVEAGAPGDETFLILEGRATALVGGGAPTEVDARHNMTNLVALLTDAPAIATIKSKGHVKALRITHENFNKLREIAPEFDRASRKLAEDNLTNIETLISARAEGMVQWAKAAKRSLGTHASLPDAPLARKISEEHHGSPIAIWLGILLDGIPESLVIGAGMLGMLAGALAGREDVRFVEIIPFTLIAGLFLSNFPEALSSSSNMLSLGWSRTRVFMMWFSLMVMTALGAGAGYLLAENMGHVSMALLEGLAAGAMLTMIAAAMIPEAVVMGSGTTTGLSVLAGFLAAVMFKLLE